MTALFASLLGGQDWIVLLVLGFLLFVVFGRRLPEVGRYLGKGIVEFKKGIKGLEDDVDGSIARHDTPVAEQQPRPPQRVASTAPKFEDNPGTITTAPKA